MYDVRAVNVMIGIFLRFDSMVVTSSPAAGFQINQLVQLDDKKI